MEGEALAAGLAEMSSGLGFEPEGSEGGTKPDPTAAGGTGSAPAGGASAGIPAGTGDGKTGGSPVSGVAAGTGTDSGRGAGSPGGEQKPAGTPAGTAPSGGNPAAPAGATDFPKTWRPDPALQAEWAAAPAGVKAEIAKREEDFMRGLEQYKGDANFGKTVGSALAPYLPIMRQYNIDPAAQVANLTKAHFTLATGTPDAKTALLRDIIQNYGLAELLPRLGVGAAQPGQGQQPGGADAYTDPAVVALHKQVEDLKLREQAREADRATTIRQGLEHQVDTFLADTKEFPHASKVLGEIATLMQAGTPTLKEAYAKAVWLNPETRAAEILRQQTEAEAKRVAEEAARVEEAKKATSANVKSSSKSASATAPLGSWDDTMKETLGRLKARAS